MFCFPSWLHGNGDKARRRQQGKEKASESFFIYIYSGYISLFFPKWVAAAAAANSENIETLLTAAAKQQFPFCLDSSSSKDSVD